jgi:phosphomannomutase
LIAGDYTFENLRRAAGGLAAVLPTGSRVAVGYDHRFLSAEFAEAAAGVLRAAGHRPVLADRPCTSPALSFALKAQKAAAGVMITASHNPPGYNGFKIKVPPGCSADEALTRKVEGAIPDAAPDAARGDVPRFDPETAYLEFLLSRLDRALWKGAKLPLAADGMHGPGGRLWEVLFDRLGVKGTLVRASRDPLFGGTAPEPIEKNLTPLKEAVVASRSAAGLGVDGDADRLGAVDDTGAYWAPHTVFPVILEHLAVNRKLKGAVVQSVSLGYVSERLAQSLKLPFEEVSVGFKYVAARMQATKVLWGGEESGGYGVGLWSPERDGLLSGLLLAEASLAARKPLSELRRDLTKRFGASHYDRVDHPLRTAVTDKSAWAQEIARRLPAKIAGVAVKETRPRDGLKIIFDDDSWLLLRPSGTEPLLRTYAETPDPARTERLLSHAREWVAARTPSEK